MKELRQWIRTSPTFRQLLSYYLCIFLIPFLLLTGALYVLLNRYVVNEVAGIRASQAADMMAQMTKLDEGFRNVCTQLQMDTNIKETCHPAQAAQAAELINRLNAQKSASPYARAIWYASCDNDYIFSNRSSASLSLFCDYYYHDTGYDAASFQQSVLETHDFQIIKAREHDGDKQVLLFSYPVLHVNAPVRWHKALFAVAREDILAFGRSMLDTLEGSFAFFYNGECVAGESNCQADADAYLSPVYQRLAARQASPHVIQTGSGKAVQLYTLGGETNLLVRNGPWALILQIGHMFDARNRFLALFSAGGVLLLCIGILFCLRYSKIVYSPIVDLKNTAIELSKVRENGERAGDFSTINHHLALLKRQHEYLNERFDSNVCATRDFLTRCLLYGRFENQDAYNAAAAPLNMDMRHPIFRVAVLDPAGASAAFAALNAAFPERARISFLCSAQPLRGGVTVILSYEETFEPRLASALERLRRALNAPGLSLGVGQQCASLAQIPLSYLQAVFSLNQPDAALEGVCFYEPPEKPEMGPAETFNLVTRRLTEGARTQREAYDILSSLLALIAGREEVYASFVASAALFMAPMQAKKAGVPPQLDPLLTLLTNCAGLFSQPDARTDDPVILKMRRYVQQMCMKSEFSLKMMADEFSMSESGMSNFFKKHIGISLIDYITDIRMQQAVLLLTNSELNIHDIGVMVGYNNTNSFIRRFKQVMNVTPGEYRQLNAGGADSSST